MTWPHKEAFDGFWKAYPRRIGKLDAMKAYEKALTLTTHEEIMTGIETYRANKPDYCDWCHPSTFLNQGRWMDEYEAPKADYGFQMAGGEGPNLTAFIVNGVWREGWGEKPESVQAAKTRLDEINAPRYGLKVVSSND